MKEEQWEADVHSFLFLELDSERDKAFDSLKLGESIPFDPGIFKSRSSDSSLLQVPYLPIEFLLPYIGPIELIHPRSSDLEPNLNDQSCEVSGWFNEHIYVVIIISTDHPPDKYAFFN